MSERPPHFARAGLLLLMLFLASFCVVSKSGMQKQQITLKLEEEHRHVIELENQVKPESIDIVLHGRSADGIECEPCWYSPQYQCKSALGYVLFKPAPGDVKPDAAGNPAARP